MRFMSRPAGFHRPTIGISALLLLAIGAALEVWWSSDAMQPWIAACIRVGSVLAVLWLAYPQVSRVPAWLIAVGIGLVFVALAFARKPQVLILATIVLFVVMRLRAFAPAVDRKNAGRPSRK
jgi:hypothetical protein